VGAEHFFDFEGGNLVAAGFENVHARAAEEAVGAVFDHGRVAGSKPAVHKRVSRLIGLAPVFREDTRPLELQFAIDDPR